MIKAVFFDFDGVLTTDSSGSYTTCKNISKVAGLPLDHILSCYRVHSHKLRTGTMHYEIWDEFCNSFGMQLGLGMLTRAFLDTPKNNEMFELVKKLRKHYKVGIITDNNKERFEALRKEWRLNRLFDSLTLSAEVGSTKNEPEIFESALGSLDVSAEDGIFIDNKEANLIVPKKLGFKTIFYDPEKNDIQSLVIRLKGLGVVV